MELILLVAASSLLLVAFYYAQHRKFTKALTAYRQNSTKVVLEDYTKIPKIIMIILVLFGLTAFILGLVKNDSSSWALGAIIMVVFTTEYFSSNTQFRLYHDDRSFLTPDGPALLSNIKGFEINRLARHIGFVKVQFYNRAEVSVCPQAYHWLDERLQAEAEAKKERKLENKNKKDKKR